MPGHSTKVGPAPGRSGNPIYPGFYPTVPPGSGRIQRLEKGSQRQQRGGLRPTAGNYSRLPIKAITGSINNQVISIANSTLKKIGGQAISANVAGFAYTSTGTSVTWYWDGTNGSRVPVITRGDGTRFTIPTAGSGLTVTGLANSTTYYFLPFWNTNNLCNIGWVPGTTGSPKIAFVLSDTTDPVNAATYFMESTLQGNEPLSDSFMTAATAAGGGSGGGGAGGGGGGCVMSGTDVIPVGDLSCELEVLPNTEWIHLRIADTRELYCTYDHPLYHAVNGKVRADSLVEGEMIITDRGEQTIVTAEFHRRVCSKYRVHMKEGHLYWANGFLSHNYKGYHGR